MEEVIEDRSSEIAISIKKITKSFKQQTPYTDVLSPLSFSILKQETVAIIGPSGCGKSTLLRLIAGLDDFDTGSISIFDCDPQAAKNKGYFGFAFQFPSLLPWRSVKGNINLPFDINPHDDHEELVEKSLQLVELTDHENKFPFELSGGMSERVGLARALVRRPKILLLDEPFRSLDEITRQALNKKLRDIICSENNTSTTILVTHSVIEAIYLANKVILLSESPAKIVKTWSIPNVTLNSTEDVYNNEVLLSIKQDMISTMETLGRS